MICLAGGQLSCHRFLIGLVWLLDSLSGGLKRRALFLIVNGVKFRTEEIMKLGIGVK
ncbi:hypothetical protein N624_1029 [Levilactobacillus brevis]|nr:hypothetical protein N624_1029 [Levilactobacillus brevis]